MGNKAKSFASAIALGFVVLFFGPATSKARAQHLSADVSFQGHFPLPHGSINIQAGNRGYHGNGWHYRHSRPYHGRSYYRHGRPYHGRSYYKHHRPYRLVRVRVFDPYPRWVFRRVYYSQRVGAPYCRPY